MRFIRNSFMWGVLCGAFIVMALYGGSAVAEQFARTIAVHQYPVSFYINGEKVNPKDTRPGYFFNGKAEVPLSFIYKGTTYVPIRFIGESLGQEVGWDGNSYSVWVGDKPARFLKSSEAPNQPSVVEESSTVYGIRTGDSVDRVREILGNPDRRDFSHIGVEWWIYKKDPEHYMQVGIRDGKVETIYSNGTGWQYEKVKMGMTLDRLTQIWGDPEAKLYITDSFRIEQDGGGEKLIYKKNGRVIVLYLDRLDSNKVRGIRVSTPELFMRTVPSGFSYAYRDPADIQLPELTEQERARAESSYEKQMWDLTNVIRYRHGLPILQYNDQVAAIAKSHSQDMYQNNFVSHQSPTTGGLMDRLKRSPLPVSAFGENIAVGYVDAIDAVEGLMNSQGHRENILNDYANEMGAGVILRSNASYTHFYTQNFYYNQNR
ncbi:MAG: hypothetical protein H0Z33_00365 [Bacillaceae bacterium]|nr:hypothetical protein [Bacillaceae bacterium]